MDSCSVSTLLADLAPVHLQVFVGLDSVFGLLAELQHAVYPTRSIYNRSIEYSLADSELSACRADLAKVQAEQEAARQEAAKVRLSRWPAHVAARGQGEDDPGLLIPPPLCSKKRMFNTRTHVFQFSSLKPAASHNIISK